jgi:hypothetical protein
VFLAWAMGYVSGMNSESPDRFFDLGSKSPEQMSGVLRAYCDKHPLGNFQDAVLELAKSLPVLLRSDLTKSQKNR